MTDIDIDFVDPAAALKGLQHVAAISNLANGRSRHLSGVYFQDIPCDPLDGMAAWDYKQAAQAGYFKVDFLTNKLYVGVRDEAHLITLLATEPPWDRLNDSKVVDRLYQIHDHFEVIQKIEPRCIEELAICLALIRPGKRYLLQRPRFEIMRDIWLKNDNEEFTFKKAHAIAYAAAIVVQLNLLVEQQQI